MKYRIEHDTSRVPLWESSLCFIGKTGISGVCPNPAARLE